MLLYHAISSYQLLEVVLHKVKYNTKEKAILFISFDVVRRLPNYGDFNKYFFKTIVYDNGIGNREIAAGKNVNLYFQSIFQENDINIDSIENIYACCVHHSFGIFLAQNNLPFNYMEDGAGAISRPEVLEMVEKKYTRKHELCLKFGLYDASNPLIKKRIYNKKYQKNDFNCLNGEHFDIVNELEQLPESQRTELVRIFVNSDVINIEKNTALLLTEHFANLKIFSWEEQIILYQLITDYFLKDYSLVIKPHPDDLMYYSILFPQSYIIKDRFPAELLPFIFRKRPACVATVSSTAIYGLKQFFSKTLEFNYEFSHYRKQFHHLNKYYIAFKYLTQTYGPEYSCHYLGVNIAVSKAFNDFLNIGPKKVHVHKSIDELSNFKSNCIWIIDAIEKPEECSEAICGFLSDLSENACVIFINSNSDFCFYNYDYRSIWANIYPIQITKSALASKVYQNMEPEIIYVFKKGVFTEMDTDEKILENSGISISAESFSGDILRIKTLEGILSATEKRLLYYIHLVEKLENDSNDEGDK